MITNIIKNLIKDVPSIANSTISLIYNREGNDFAVSIGYKITLVLNNPPQMSNARNTNEWKLAAIAESIYEAATKEDESTTAQQLSDKIDNIIANTVVLWNMAETNVG